MDSLNVSVAASLILYEAYTWRVRHLGRHGDLDETQQSILMAAMLLRHKVDQVLAFTLCMTACDFLELVLRMVAFDKLHSNQIVPSYKPYIPYASPLQKKTE